MKKAFTIPSDVFRRRRFISQIHRVIGTMNSTKLRRHRRGRLRLVHARAEESVNGVLVEFTWKTHGPSGFLRNSGIPGARRFQMLSYDDRKTLLSKLGKAAHATADNK